MPLHVLVLAGGSGTRLWPLSRGGTPKHLLPLGPGGATLLRATLERVAGLGEGVQVVTAAAQAEQCAAELEAAGLDPGCVIAEPVARGTGPALGLACALLARRDPDAVILSVHADHRVTDRDAYRAAVIAAAGWAATTDGLATVGLTPAYASTGLGYVECAEPLSATEGRAAFSVEPELAAAAAALPAFQAAGFREKPSADVAADFVRGGRHLWNLGLFAWPARVFLDALRASDRTMHDALQTVADARLRHNEQAVGETYAALRSAAVEPLVLERASRLCVVQAAFAWSDLGSWQDLYEARVEEGTADAAANVVEGDTLLIDASRNAVVARGGRTIALVGVDDLVVVDTPQALLVVPRDQSQRVREVVEKLPQREDR